MHHIARRAAGFAVVAGCLMGLGAGATAASVGTIFGIPHIGGTVRPGEFEEAKKDLTGHFGKPLGLDISPDSDALEVMRIGLWLREQQPAIELRGSCVGACAWFMLDSGRSLKVAKDTVIAFGMLPEIWWTLRFQLDRGDFGIDDERSAASIAAFKQKVDDANWRAAKELQTTRQATSRLAPWVRQFVEGATGFKVTQLTHGDENQKDFSLRVESYSQRCIWWIPDAEGLQQLGLSVSGYRPPTPDRAAKILRVSPKLIYIGPALRERPEAPLCAGDPTADLTMP